jgi:hypothetical protein
LFSNRVHLFLFAMSADAASPIEVHSEKVYVVRGGALAGEVVVRSEFIKEVDNYVFCMLQYTKGPAARLMQGRLSKGKRPLCQTAVIDEMKELAVLAYVRGDDADGEPHEESVAEEIRNHHRQKGRNAAAVKVVAARAPQVGRAPASEFKVLSNGYRTFPLWFELTAASVVYLQAFASQTGVERETGVAKFSVGKNRWYVETVASDRRKARKFFHSKDEADRHVQGQESPAADGADNGGGSPVLAGMHESGSE